MPCQEGDVFINCVKVFLLGTGNGVVVDALPLVALDVLDVLVALVALPLKALADGAALVSLPQPFLLCTNRRYIEGSAET